MASEEKKDLFTLLRQFSAFLLTGTVLALVLANVMGSEAYHHLVDHPLLPDTNPIAHALTHGRVNFSFHFIVNDLFMVFFFGIAMKEVSESFLPGGALSSFKKAAMPVVATLGGVFGPVSMFFLLHFIFNPAADAPMGAGIFKAWAVPTATDIAYAWLFAKLVFGAVHPAVTFLLVLAVLDDLIGMMIIAVFYSSDIQYQWMGLVVLTMVICEVMRRMGVKSFWPYILIGAPLSWYGLHSTGVHAALALVPVVPFMPHAERDAGLFVEEAGEHGAHGNDTLAHFEHFFKPIVDVGMFTFGLANAGVVLGMESLSGSATWIIFLSLMVGKTVGVTAFAFLGTMLGLSLPKPMNFKQVMVLGCVAGIGFTVALFVTGVALKSGHPDVIAYYKSHHIEDMLKLGALLSFFSGFAALGLAKALGVKKINTQEELDAAVAAAS
jgi:NhaA family Na+:H+ antiporter